MNSFSIVVLLAVVACTAAATPAITLSNLSLTPFQRAFGFVPQPKGVEGIQECGAVGDIVDVTFTECNLVPCQTWIGNVYYVDVKFKPSISHPAMRLQLYLVHDGQSDEIVDTEVPNSAVEAGLEYGLGYSMRITGAFTGPATIAFRLFGEGGNVMEICFIVGIIVEDPRP